ncbi:MAG: hypothetical protein DLM72_08135 [Candidatus Nitrosopolaris wilkensis]|nr:MAG: hypothetical protein DLM72_08135 [Candidatus Nitrosopolaris wilkensis]
MDYITSDGIQNRTKANPNEYFSFTTKELVDNTLDYLELPKNKKKWNNQQQYSPIVKVIISVDTEKGYVKLAVSNTNYNDDGAETFSLQKLSNIFNFDQMYSSKRNQRKIIRGG